MTALLFRGGRVIDPANGLDRVCDVLVDGGLIQQVGDAIAQSGAREIDVTGSIVTPAFVDLHTHLREPGYEQKGTIATETEAALRGGFTTVCAMPNTTPAPDSATIVQSLLELIARTARVRVLPIGCVTRSRAGKELADLSELADAGCVAISDDGNPVADGRLMRNALEYAAALGIPLSEHCDSPSLNADGVMNEGRISERLGLAGQPAAAEVAAIARNIALAETTGAHLHIAHVSTARSVELVAEAKARGLRVTAEVTPSHLFLTEDAVFGAGPEAAYDTNARINPPLRTETDRRALLRALNDGIIDAIATDHAPHAIEDKLCEFDHAAPGISCIETAAASLLTLIARGELKIEPVIRALTAGPVATFALGSRIPGIGALTPGISTDLVVLDPSELWTVDTSKFASRGKNTPLNGQSLTGRVQHVVMNGELAFSSELASV